MTICNVCGGIGYHKVGCGATEQLTPRQAQDLGMTEEEWEAHRHRTMVEDVVNHPSHYTAYKGVEIIDLTEQMNFNRGNAVKYISRAGLKNKATEIQDLEKAAWYINREIERLKNDAQ